MHTEITNIIDADRLASYSVQATVFDLQGYGLLVVWIASQLIYK